ncbi:MAG: TetR/AcrR family transcriptional regulator C-terminal domain-containing protein [Devosia sp.]|nr:TetR/AcrR family transcriptional regulator C-terminal domain-containing protein [Devosia sp.]
MAIAKSQIVAAAIALLDEVGIDQLTTRKLAERLGVQQPALYWHFKNKRELLDAVNEAIMIDGHISRVPKPGERWQDFVKANARSFRASLLAHRDGARIHAGTRPGPSDLKGVEAQLKLYFDAGFDEVTAAYTGIAISRYVLGSVLEEQAELERPEEGLDRAFDDYPLLKSFVENHLMNDRSDVDERTFELGLELIVDGLAARLARSTGNQQRIGQVRRGEQTRTPK